MFVFGKIGKPCSCGSPELTGIVRLITSETPTIHVGTICPSCERIVADGRRQEVVAEASHFVWKELKDAERLPRAELTGLGVAEDVSLADVTVALLAAAADEGIDLSALLLKALYSVRFKTEE